MTKGKFGKATRSAALHQAGQLINTVRHIQDGKLEWLRTERIEHDIKQPRRLYQIGLTREAIIAHREGRIDLRQHENPEVRERFDGIEGLAASIQLVGLQQPIVVRVKEGSDPADPEYVLVAGARRHLAHLLAAIDEIPAIVRLIAGETRLRAIQLIENIQRESLSALEIILGLAELNELHKATSERDLKGKDVMELLHVGRSQAFLYRGLIHTNIEVIEALQEGLITSLELAYDLNKLEPEARKQALTTLRAGAPLELPDPSPAAALPPPPLEQVSPEQEVKQEPKKPGRPVTAVNLGKVADTGFVRDLVASYLGQVAFDAEYGDVDWDDLKAAKAAWDRFVTSRQQDN